MRGSEAFQRLLKYLSFFSAVRFSVNSHTDHPWLLFLGGTLCPPHAGGRQGQARTCATCPYGAGAQGPYCLSINSARGTLQPTIRHVYSCIYQRCLHKLPVNNIKIHLSSAEASRGRPDLPEACGGDGHFTLVRGSGTVRSCPSDGGKFV